MNENIACDVLRRMFPGFDVLRNDEPAYARILLGRGNCLSVSIVDGDYKVSLAQPLVLNEAKLRELVRIADNGHRINGGE